MSAVWTNRQPDLGGLGYERADAALIGQKIRRYHSLFSLCVFIGPRASMVFQKNRTFSEASHTTYLGLDEPR
jgi:hypothetical protein